MFYHVNDILQSKLDVGSKLWHIFGGILTSPN